MQRTARKRKESKMLTKTERTLAVYRERGKEGKALRRVYRELFNPELYEKAYAKIYANPGATTKGSEEDTLDGMSKERIEKIIEKVKKEQYRWRPVRRTYIPKGNGEKRPLGIPTGDDKLLQSAIRILLEEYYEPGFSPRSHGFRPQKGCHTALEQVMMKHHNVSWFIEGDIKGCFDNIDHKILIETVGEKIEDGRLKSLIQKLLKAGYMEDWRKKGTYSGTPQGGIISPLLANIYLDKLDKWVEKELLPKYNYSAKPRGGRRTNPEYQKLSGKMGYAKKTGRKDAFKAYKRERAKISSVMSHDEKYRKLEYIRYADDFILSFAGPKAEAEEIKTKISEYLKDTLKLEMSQEKTLITHARTERARFLGYEISISKPCESNRKVTGTVRFNVPREVVTNATRKYTKKGKPEARNTLLQESDISIIWLFQTEVRGLVNYYQMANNLRTLSKVTWAAQGSMLKTLANKHKISVKKIAAKHRTTARIDGKMWTVYEARVEREGKKPIVARYGGISLARRRIPQKISDTVPETRRGGTNSEILQRMKSNECEMCGDEGEVQVHHVRKLKDLTKPGRKTKPAWIKRMASLRRKTLMCCPECHRAIHNGKHLKKWDYWKEALESRVR